MYKKFDFVKKTKLSAGKTFIKFGESAVLRAVYIGKFENGYHCFKIGNPKLDFEIMKIFDVVERDMTNKYDKSKKTFVTYLSPDSTYTFHISANIQLKPDRFTNYQLHIPADEFRNLKLRNFIEAEIVLPDHDNLKFTYYVKKIAPSKVELFIVNPYDVEIQGMNFQTRLLKEKKIIFHFRHKWPF
uniref:Uncharacterized protein n=1 Tax=Panagrolaimus davidi TaxID=227884 RepID=A0A914PUT9_9BILA